MTHQNIIDLRELIGTIEQLVTATYLQIHTLKNKACPINNTHHAGSIAACNQANILETSHNNCVNIFNMLRVGVDRIITMGHTADSNIDAFHLYEQLSQWQRNYTNNVVNKLRGISV